MIKTDKYKKEKTDEIQNLLGFRRFLFHGSHLLAQHAYVSFAFCLAALCFGVFLEMPAAYALACLGGGCALLLLLTPGCEAFWLHPGLTPDFFRCRRRAFSLL